MKPHHFPWRPAAAIRPAFATVALILHLSVRRSGRFAPLALACGAIYLTATSWGQAAQPTSANKASASALSPSALPACGEAALNVQSPGVQTVKMTTGPRSGLTDPMRVPAGRYQLVPVDGVAAYIPGDKITTNYYDNNSIANLGKAQSVALESMPSNPDGFGAVPIFATAGHVLRSDSDQLVSATRLGDPSSDTGKVQIRILADQVRATSAIPFKLPDHLLPRVPNSTDFIAIAHGDLDRKSDSDGNLHDEVIVAYASSQSSADYTYTLAVLNYTAGDASHPQVATIQFDAQKPQFNDIHNASEPGGGVLNTDNIISVAVGDFDGDGNEEIAVATLGNDRVGFRIFRYATTNDVGALTQVRAQDITRDSLLSGAASGYDLVGTIALTAGNFDGDNTDELALATARWHKPTDGSLPSYAIGLTSLKVGSDFAITVKDSNQVDSFPEDSYFPHFGRPRVALDSGQFLFDSSHPYRSKQLVIAYRANTKSNSWNQNQISLKAYAVSSDGLLSRLGSGDPAGIREAQTIQTFSIAAGGFHPADATPPTESVTLFLWAGSPTAQHSTVRLYSWKVTSSGVKQVSGIGLDILGGVDLRARLPLVAYDRTGDSVYLGDPVHIVLQGSPETDFIMQEPPKHAYWDETKHAVENFSRFDQNNVQLFNGESKSFSTLSTDHSGFSVGTSISASASATVGYKKDLFLASFDGKTKIEAQVQGNYDFERNKDTYNSGYHARSSASTGNTDRDDFLKGDMQFIDVWRYRMYGIKPGKNLNAFYEILMPGERIPFAGAGQSFFWYQPRHENGNILTYPAALGSSRFIPDDLGSYTTHDQKTVEKPIAPASLNYFDGNGTSSTLRWSDEVGNGETISNSHYVTESADIKATFVGEVTSKIGTHAEFTTCGSFQLRSSQSEGDSSTSDNKTTVETSITLNKAAGIPANSYPFYPVVYSTKDGTLKVSFAVPNPADAQNNAAGHETYAEIYGGRPDPALNLPARFQPSQAGTGELETWEPNLRTARKAMRGLFFRHSEPDPVTGAHLLYAFSPTAGEKVRIEARVYNLSTAQPAINTTVEFQVIPYSNALNSELCDAPINQKPGVQTGLVCPQSARTTVGTVTIPRLEPLQFTCVSEFDNPAVTGCSDQYPAYIDWNTTGFAPVVGSSEYRVYVVLNRGNSGGPETYPIEPDPVHITHVENAAPMVVTAPGSTLETGDYVIIGGVEGLSGANGTFRITRVSPDQFSLDGTTISTGNYTGGGLATELDPGQNNEGYGTIAVTAPASLTVARGEGAPQDYLGADALEAVNPAVDSQLHATQITATQNAPLELRFTAHSSRLHTDPARVLLFDGDPASGAPAIADQRIYPGLHGSEGSGIWFDWTPQTTGQHHLVAVLYEGSADTHLAGELNVNVEP